MSASRTGAGAFLCAVAPALRPQAPRDPGPLRHPRRRTLRTRRGGRALPRRPGLPARTRCGRRRPRPSSISASPKGCWSRPPSPAPIVVPREPPLAPEPAVPARAPHRPVHAALQALLHRAADRHGPAALRTIARLADEFAALQGLRFIVSGGEPLMHRHFWKLNERLPAYPFRSILLTNGTLLDREAARALRFHEVQVSLDGPQDAHDLLRGTGSYPPRDRRAAAPRGGRGADLGGERGLRGESRAFRRTGDDPRGVSAARLVDRRPLPGRRHGRQPRAAPRHGAGRRAHGALVRRGLLRLERRLGLRGAPGRRDGGRDDRQVRLFHRAGAPGTFARDWRPRGGSIPRWRLEELACRCSHLAECRGGCRFRAQAHGDLLGPDPAMCHLRGVPVGGDRTDALRSGRHPSSSAQLDLDPQLRPPEPVAN